MMDLDTIMKVAQEAALEAGEVLLNFLGPGLYVTKKGPRDLVTEADLAAEQIILKRIQGHFPQHSFLLEESGKRGESECQWVVDPLDGTTNYAHGYPFFSVSIAFKIENQIRLGVVYDPVAQELFSACLGQGSLLNGKAIGVSKEKELSQSFLATGFSYEQEEMETNLDLFRSVSKEVQAVRRDGSAALDLCYVACGRFDGYWELSLSPWDMAAGKILVEEAGGRISCLDGSPFQLTNRTILATNGYLHDRIGSLLVAD